MKFDRQIKQLIFHTNTVDLTSMLKERNCFVAGGALRSIFTGEEINDLDVYFRDFESFKRTILDMENDAGYCRSYTDKSVLFTLIRDNIVYNVQFIFFKFFDNPEEIFDTFDFTNCMALYDFKTNEIIAKEEFFLHNMQRRLVVNVETSYPILSALRVKKYTDRKYSISKKEFVKIMIAVNRLKINDWSELENHIGGMYGSNIKDVIDITKEYNFENVIEELDKLSEENSNSIGNGKGLNFVSNMTETESTKLYEDFKLVIRKMEKKPIVLYKTFSNGCYFEYDGERIFKVKIDVDKLKEKDINFVVLPASSLQNVKFYKMVRK